MNCLLCKDSGKITLFTSIVDCECVNLVSDSVSKPDPNDLLSNMWDRLKTYRCLPGNYYAAFFSHKMQHNHKTDKGHQFNVACCNRKEYDNLDHLNLIYVAIIEIGGNSYKFVAY